MDCTDRSSKVSWLFGWLDGWLVGGWCRVMKGGRLGQAKCTTALRGWLVGWLVGGMFGWAFCWLVDKSLGRLLVG